VLTLQGLTAFYGKSQVLHGLDLQVGSGEIVGLLGRNGAGRSTTLKAIVGQVEARGVRTWRGADLALRKPFEIARAGIAWVPEQRAVFPLLTVEQNLLLGAVPTRARRWQPADLYALFAALGARRDVLAGRLSGGEQQMLALARALMGNPDLILVDEPTEGLAPQVVAQIATFLRHLRGLGVAVLLVEQKRAIALDLSDRIVVLGHGRAVFSGTPAALQADPGVTRDWLQVAARTS